MSSKTFFGADVEQLHATALAFAEGAQYLAEVTARTTVVLAAVTWNGPDGDRMRAHWSDEAAPAIAQVAGRLRDAGLQLVREAQRQLDASTDGGGGATSVPAGAGTSPTVAASAATSSSVDYRAMLGKLSEVVTTLPTAAEFGRAVGELTLRGFDWSSHLLRNDDALRVIAEASEQAGKGAGIVEGALGRVLTAKDAVFFAKAASEGDVAGVIENGVPLALSGQPLLGGAWTGGTMIGTAAYEGMQGTRYGDIVRDMSEGAFDENGAWGMLQVPGILGFAAYEYFTEDTPPQP